MAKDKPRRRRSKPAKVVRADKPTPESVEKILRTVRWPGTERDIVSLGIIREISLQGCTIHVALGARDPSPEASQAVAEEVRSRLKAEYEKFAVDIEHVAPPPPPHPQQAPPQGSPSPHSHAQAIPGVRHIVAVGSGKGGVGKSTVAVNLALALKKLGRRVGVMDADVYGPSIPLLMGASERPKVTARNRIVPLEVHGVQLMSMGFLVDEDAPVIWRGPMVMKLIQQFLVGVEWREADFLVVDLPPGTGDTQLTLVQSTRLSGAVVVTTPQDLALLDAARAAQMFNKVDVPVLGIVENMSVFVCPRCGEESHIFGQGGGHREAERLGIPFLGEIPLNPAIREGSDTGRPTVAVEPESPETKIFLKIAERVAKETEAASEPTRVTF
ncbi:MAG: Mrp/NBP35 family ATP-binding protein [Acidobacteriota bacterium]|nr:MAG: Mrp/NBP35 family ATP-binding protein [Acidobacteriota bacterium]